MIKKQFAQCAFAAFLALGTGSTIAATSAAKSHYDAAKKEAAVRYAEDRKLCADETTSSIRMQCLRDAKTEYSKSLSAAAVTYKNASKPASAVSATPAAKAAAVCAECGKVTALKVVEKDGEGSPLGVIAGGVAGAVLGHQVGGGRGKDVATIAGAAGGAYAGHKIEQKARATKSWLISVHFEDGTDRDFSFATDPGFAAGDAVKLSNGTVVRR